MSTSTDLKSLAPEICSLICQDPILERRDLNSSCFISHSFRREAQRLLSYRFPFLRGAGRIKAWCLSLKRRPHLALGVRDLVLLMPQQVAFHADATIARLTQALSMCINLKELTVLSQSRRRRSQQDYLTPMYMFGELPFKLTKFVNDYFNQDAELGKFLSSQMTLETLQLHSGAHYQLRYVYLPYLQTLACPAHLFDELSHIHVRRLRLNFELKAPVPYEAAMLNSHYRFRRYRAGLTSLAIFLKRKPDGRHSHFLEVMDFVSEWLPCITHLQIHQFLPIHEDHTLPFFSKTCFQSIETLVLRPPPRLPINVCDDTNLCAYVILRTRDGRRKVAGMIMKTLRTLTRLVFVGHEIDYEFRRDLKTGIITGEQLITLDEQEWALVK